MQIPTFSFNKKKMEQQEPPLDGGGVENMEEGKTNNDQPTQVLIGTKIINVVFLGARLSY